MRAERDDDLDRIAQAVDRAQRAIRRSAFALAAVNFDQAAEMATKLAATSMAAEEFFAVTMGSQDDELAREPSPRRPA